MSILLDGRPCLRKILLPRMLQVVMDNRNWFDLNAPGPFVRSLAFFQVVRQCDSLDIDGSFVFDQFTRTAIFTPTFPFELGKQYTIRMSCASEWCEHEADKNATVDFLTMDAPGIQLVLTRPATSQTLNSWTWVPCFQFFMTKLSDRLMTEKDREDEANAATPPAFMCAVTSEIMTDPVICADGHSYERAAIENGWSEAVGVL